MKNTIKHIKWTLTGMIGVVTMMVIGFSAGTMMPAIANAALDSAGTEFYLAFEDNYDNGGFRRLFITSKVNTTGSITAPGFSSAFTVTANTVTSVDVPVILSNLGNGTIGNKSIHIVANAEITVYGLNRRQATSDAFLGLPIDILNTEYRVMSFDHLSSLQSQFAVVAPYNGTQVTITPKGTGGGHNANMPFTITMNQGEVFQLQTSTGDMTGSLITSDRPVAVFAGHKCADVPLGAFACDHLTEQMLPVQSWGMDFVTVPLATRRRGDVFRVLASQDATTVTTNGTSITLNAGQFHQMILTAFSHITSDKPVSLAQYSAGQTFDGVNSDPFMMMIPPSEQFVRDYTFSTPPSGFTNYVNVVIPTVDVATLVLDGVPVTATFTAIGSSGFSGAQILIGVGAHTISAGSPFGLYSYGFGFFDSYGYAGGTALQFINPVGDANPPVCNGSYSGIVFNGTGTDNRPTEDINGNQVLDSGEDLNGNGVIDVDTGIFVIEMAPGSTNYSVSSSFIPGDPSASFSVSPIDALVDANGTVAVTDGAGNTCSLPVSYVSNTPPTLTLNGSGAVTIEAGATYTELGATALDTQDGNISTSVSISGAVNNIVLGSYSLTYNVTDSGGLSAPSVSRTITVVDTTAPVLTVPADVSIEANAVLSTVAIGTASATDIFGFTIGDDAPATYPLGTTVVTYTATDVNGNVSIGTQNVTVADTTAPVLSVPANVTTEATGAQTTVVIGTATATDIFDATVVSDAPATFPVGTTTVTYTATDGNNLTTVGTQTVTVTDTTAPVILTPADVSVEATAVSSTVANGTATASDLVDGVVSVSNNAPATFPLGTTVVTYTASDLAGNTATATQNVTVVDTTAPVLSVPANVTTEATGAQTTVAIGTATATDIFGATVVSDAPATFPVGTTTVTYTATDGNNLTTVGTQTVTVTDTTAPVILTPADVSVEATAVSSTVAIGTATASDLVDGVVSVSNNAPASFPLGTTVVTYTASDLAGNTATATQNVTVVDTTPPALTAPANVSVEANALLSTVAIGAATASDIFGATVVNNAPATFPLGITTVTYTATDGNGLTSTATQTVTVVDTTAPALTVPASVSVEATGPQTAVVIGTATATDIFGPVSVVSDAPATYPLGITVVNWTATDANGNVSTGTQNVTVVDTTAPVVTADLTPYSRGDGEGHGKVDSDEGRFRVQFAATDLVGVTTLTAELVINGYATPVAVSLNQIIEFEYENEKTQVEEEKGVLEIEAPSMLLRVTATDSSGNSTVVDVLPRGLTGDNDVESDTSDD